MDEIWLYSPDKDVRRELPLNLILFDSTLSEKLEAMHMAKAQTD